MKPGARAVGIAESYGVPTGTQQSEHRKPPNPSQSSVAAAVVRADRAVDGLQFGTWTVGGTDATDVAVTVVDELDREDVQYLLVSGIAPAWFNVLDLPTVADSTGLPVLSVSFEASPGLESALAREFSGADLDVRLSTYRQQPPRKRVDVNDEAVFVRAVGVDEQRAREVVHAFTPEGGRPEPIRVARLAARAADEWRAGS